VVRADALRIEQAVVNVLLNAAKYGAGRDIELSVVRENFGGLGLARRDHLGRPAPPGKGRRSISGSRSRLLGIAGRWQAFVEAAGFSGRRRPGVGCLCVETLLE